MKHEDRDPFRVPAEFVVDLVDVRDFEVTRLEGLDLRPKGGLFLRARVGRDERRDDERREKKRGGSACQFHGFPQSSRVPESRKAHR